MSGLAWWRFRLARWIWPSTFLPSPRPRVPTVDLLMQLDTEATRGAWIRKKHEEGYVVTCDAPYRNYDLPEIVHTMHIRKSDDYRDWRYCTGHSLDEALDNAVKAMP
jgi:hypothetical protein